MKNLHINKTTMLGIFASSLLVTASAVYLYSPTFGSHADTSNSAEVSLTVGEAMSLSLDKNNLALTADINSFTSGDITATAITNAQYGYTLTIEDVDGSSNLTHTNSSIDSVLTSSFAGAKTSAEMDSNTWGFSLNATDFYKVPVNGSPVAIKRTNSPMTTDSEDTVVTFGAKVGNITSGTYTDSVLFTIYTNGVDGNPSDGTEVSEPGAADPNTVAARVRKMLTTNPTEVVADEPDENPRFIGSDPNNYVTYNDELWRIVGIFDGRAKLVRYEILGDYSWDSSDGVNENLGVNEWSQSKLMQELNGDYLDTTLTENTLWYSGSSLAKSATYDHTKGLSTAAQSLIDDATWYLGASNNKNGYDISWNDESLIAPYVYTHERGDLLGKTCNSNYGNQACNDTVERTETWTGKVGLIYPSDYLYSTAGGTTEDRATCLNTAYWQGHSECYENTWLYASVGYEGHSTVGPTLWTISPRAQYKYGTYVWSISGGYVYGNYDAAFQQKVLPVVYLKSGVKIASGTGTAVNPYGLSL